MKKKSIAIALASVLALLAVPALAFAAGASSLAPQMDGARVQEALSGSTAACASAAVGACAGYVDDDGNGVCDNYAAGRGQGCAGYVDADGDGACDACGSASGACPGSVDADGNGVCDSYEDGSCPGGQGNGGGYGQGHGRGQGYGHGRGCGGHGCMTR